MSRRHSQIETVICWLARSEANVVSAIEERVNFFQVMRDGVLAVPYETGLISRPVGVVFRSHAVIGVIESPAFFPVCSENLCHATVRLALGAKVELQSGLRVRIPERSGRSVCPVSRQIEVDVVTIRSVGARRRRDPKNPVGPGR